MSDREAMQQALEALEWISDCYVGDDDDAGECASCHQRSHKPHAPDCKKNNAITALKAALAEPEPEPVAPPTRRPLTDEELRQCFTSTNTAEPLAEGWPGLERFARAAIAKATGGNDE